MLGPAPGTSSERPLRGLEGFFLQEIRVPVWLWHGERDPNASVAMARQLAAAIPGCRTTFYPGEGHLHLAHRLPEILAALGPC